MKKRNKKTVALLNRLITVVIIIGTLIMAYPFLSQFYYMAKENGEAILFEKQVEKMPDREIENKMKTYKLYNESLIASISEKKDKDITDAVNQYKKMASQHEKIGYLSVPKINQNLPIFTGVSDEMLESGVGQMQGTSLPIGGKASHSVLAAHSGLPNVRLFTDLNKLRVGDEFYISNIKGTIAYKVDNIKVVLPTNFSDLSIDKNKDYVTLMTCTPYRINTHRLLVRGHRIPYNKNVKEKKRKVLYKIVLTILIVLILMIIGILYFRKRRKKKKQ